MNRLGQVWGFCLVVWLLQSPVDAQLFSGRTIGQSIGRGPNTGFFSQSTPTTAGQAQTNQALPSQIDSTARYVRGNRAKSDIVGVNQDSQQGFVGNTQATTAGSVMSSLTGLTEQRDRSLQINQPLQMPTERQIYLPTLRLDWSPPARPVSDLQSNLSQVLSSSPRFAPGTQIEVWVEGRTAVLRGRVTSSKERTLAENVALLEPGISTVQNELQVVTPESLPPIPVPQSSPPPPSPSLDVIPRRAN